MTDMLKTDGDILNAICKDKLAIEQLEREGYLYARETALRDEYYKLDAKLGGDISGKEATEIAEAMARFDAPIKKIVELRSDLRAISLFLFTEKDEVLDRIGQSSKKR